MVESEDEGLVINTSQLEVEKLNLRRKLSQKTAVVAVDSAVILRSGEELDGEVSHQHIVLLVDGGLLLLAKNEPELLLDLIVLSKRFTNTIAIIASGTSLDHDLHATVVERRDTVGSVNEDRKTKVLLVILNVGTSNARIEVTRNGHRESEVHDTLLLLKTVGIGVDGSAVLEIGVELQDELATVINAIELRVDLHNVALNALLVESEDSVVTVSVGLLDLLHEATTDDSGLESSGLRNDVVGNELSSNSDVGNLDVLVGAIDVDDSVDLGALGVDRGAGEGNGLVTVGLVDDEGTGNRGGEVLGGEGVAVLVGLDLEEAGLVVGLSVVGEGEGAVNEDDVLEAVAALPLVTTDASDTDLGALFGELNNAGRKNDILRSEDGGEHEQLGVLGERSLELELDVLGLAVASTNVDAAALAVLLLALEIEGKNGEAQILAPTAFSLLIDSVSVGLDVVVGALLRDGSEGIIIAIAIRSEEISGLLHREGNADVLLLVDVTRAADAVVIGISWNEGVGSRVLRSTVAALVLVEVGIELQVLTSGEIGGLDVAVLDVQLDVVIADGVRVDGALDASVLLDLEVIGVVAHGRDLSDEIEVVGTVSSVVAELGDLVDLALNLVVASVVDANVATRKNDLDGLLSVPGNVVGKEHSNGVVLGQAGEDLSRVLVDVAGKGELAKDGGSSLVGKVSAIDELDVVVVCDGLLLSTCDSIVMLDLTLGLSELHHVVESSLQINVLLVDLAEGKVHLGVGEFIHGLTRSQKANTEHTERDPSVCL